MNVVKAFIDGLTPGNYFLTKSMEITKIKTSGTLWYLKKFLVLYDGIFLSKSARTTDGMQKIIESFEYYIKSLPKAQQKEAEDFFFPENIDIRKDYKKYYEFAGISDFSNQSEVNRYFALVDKYYFVYLMNIGGQSGIKAYIKDNLYRDDFAMNKLNDIIKNYISEHPKEHINETQIINDYPAALRNERQILFYFGFVHSRTNGASEREFASLTPIGDLAIAANSKEFALIWEHQKIKMISQPVTVELPSISGCKFCCEEKFKLNYSPYYSILKCLDVNSNLIPRFYDLVLARSNNDNIEDVIKYYNLLSDNLNLIKSKIEKYGIRSDLASEDFEKEIKKYLLGVRNDLVKDNNGNYLASIKSNPNNSWEVVNSKRLHKMIFIYSQIEEYKKKKYFDLYEESEKELRKKYIATAKNNNDYKVNHKIKLKWDLYNIHKDNNIILALIINDYVMLKDLTLEDINYEELTDYAKKFFGNILKSINLKKVKEIKQSLKNIVDLILNESLVDAQFEEVLEIEKYYVNDYSMLNSEDLMNKIIEVSKENVKPKLDRKRDGRIINLLNTYYLVNYSDEDKLIKCECCGKKTFLKQNNEPYLEYHHLIPFGIVDGPDHYENIFGICPMCHRKLHYAKDNLKNELYNGFDVNNHFKKSIVKRLTNLYKNNILKSYQLEYALAEQIISESEYNQILS